jgi:hypothetical protein
LRNLSSSLKETYFVFITNAPTFSGKAIIFLSIERQGAVNVFLKVKIIKALMRNNVGKTELLLLTTEVSGEKERRFSVEFTLIYLSK